MNLTITTLLRKLKGLKLVIVASVLTAAEGLVAMGYELPGSNMIPVRYRALAIFALTVAAFIMRYLAQRAESRRGQ